MNDVTAQQPAPTGELEEQKKLTTIIYLLYALGFLVGITSLAAIIINYLKRDEVRGTWLESHFRWQIRTFWFALLWGFIGAVTTPIFIGPFIMLADAVWVVYRIVKGWLNLNDNKPMYAEQAAAA